MPGCSESWKYTPRSKKRSETSRPPVGEAAMLSFTHTAPERREKAVQMWEVEAHPLWDRAGRVGRGRGGREIFREGAQPYSFLLA